jgi:hypothetical protein
MIGRCDGPVGEDEAVGADLGRWEPLTVDDVVEVMAGVAAPWWIAGGWAIDLHWNVRRVS